MLLLALEGRLCRCRVLSAIVATPSENPSARSRDYVPFLLVLTYLRASASCSSICVCRYFSRFCSMSSCDRRVRMAFFGVSFRFCAAAPPNQPHMMIVGEDVDVVVKGRSRVVEDCRRLSRRQRVLCVAVKCVDAGLPGQVRWMVGLNLRARQNSRPAEAIRVPWHFEWSHRIFEGRFHEFAVGFVVLSRGQSRRR